MTERATRSRTPSVVLALAPEPAVAVIVVVPGPRPVASPVASMVATAPLLLSVHVTAVPPVPVIVTGAAGAALGPCPHQAAALPGPRAHPHGGRRTPPARPVPELPLDVLSPALHCVVPKDRTGVFPPGGDGDGPGDASHPHGSRRIRNGPVAELPLAVPSPAPHRAVPKERAGVIAPSGDGEGARDAAHPHGNGRTEPSGLSALSASGPVAELPLGVPSPAPHRAVPKERTGVIAPSDHSDGPCEGPGPVAADHRDRHGRAVVEGPVAALPRVARPPAPHRAVPKERARVLGPSDNGVRCGEAADGDRNGGVGEGPIAVAELPELVPPRALRRPVGKTHTGKECAG